MDTLVLDVSYTPLYRLDWKRVITLLWQGKIEVLEEYDDWIVHSVSFELKVPSVVRWLRGKFKRRAKNLRFSRMNIYARDNGQCQYCGKHISLQEVTYDHVIPRSQKGITSWTNIVSSCNKCNQKKGGKTPEMANMKLLSIPIKPDNLPNKIGLTLSWNKNMPSSWKKWLPVMKDAMASAIYWNSELDKD